jgi:dienelactone hydrolase
MTLSPGALLGRYRIIDQLGAGGMGVVYRARDDRLQRDVAIKVLPPWSLDDEAARRRFQKEALALAKLSHPNIAAVYDVGEEADTAYLVMECVAGESLAARLERSPIPAATALDITVQIARALGDAHDHGVVHRDLKPANVMITPTGMVKVLDFGLAKLLGAVDQSSATLSQSDIAGPGGTPLYMSPEQFLGEQLDHRTDIWSLGVLLFESLTGRPPFRGATSWALLKAVSESTPPTLRSIRPDLPPAAEAVVSRALSKDPAARYQTAAAMAEDASAALATITSPNASGAGRTARLPATTLVPLVFASACIIAGGAWLAVRASHRSWARESARAAADSLTAADRPLAAFLLLNKAVGYAPDDTALATYARENTQTISVTSSPPGAGVAIQDYVTPDSAWHSLGTTPITDVTVPKGYFRWRLSQPGVGPVITAPLVARKMNFALDSSAKAAAGMVRVGTTRYVNLIGFIGWVGPFNLPNFDIDRFEVTNREYQEFVDSGGYRDRRYWHETFIDHGREVSWEDAMLRFRDATGRPAPSTWSGGHYPEGQADYPAAGISWYEASAYAVFRGKELPTMAQWYLVAPPAYAALVGRMSNMSGSHVVAVGTFPGVGPYGTYDMAGNVREWVQTATDDGARFILGGAWGAPAYLYASAEKLPAFDRSAINGFRCVHNFGPNPPRSLEPVKMLARDFAHFTPASDAVFHAYQAMYQYDKTPLNAKSEGVVQKTADWRREMVTLDAAYHGERMAVYVYIPSHVRPPYQTVVFFPSARIDGMHDSRQSLGDTAYFDFIVQSGRAVVYPVYQGTYERTTLRGRPAASQRIELTTERSKDLERTLDYIATRPDLNHDRVGYLGVSMGAAEGEIYATLAQDRLRTAIFVDGGYFLGTPPPGGDQADFAPRMKKPVLMVNGHYDATFTYTEAQLPMFRMLGTPAADKRLVVLEGAHDIVSMQRPALVRAVLDWLDKYLGRVE